GAGVGRVRLVQAGGAAGAVVGAAAGRARDAPLVLRIRHLALGAGLADAGGRLLQRAAQEVVALRAHALGLVHLIARRRLHRAAGARLAARLVRPGHLAVGARLADAGRGALRAAGA